MTTYSEPNGGKIELDPGTVKMFEALSLASKKPVLQLAAQAVEMLRAAMFTEPKQRKTRGGAQ